MRVDRARAHQPPRLSGVGSALATCVLVVLGTTACGGTTKAQAPAATAGSGLSLSGTPAERAALLRRRLAAAGYVIHAVPASSRENGLDVAPGPVVVPVVPALSFTAVAAPLNPDWTRLHREIAAITARTHRAAQANHGLSNATYGQLLGIAAQVKVLSLKVRTILLFASTTEATLYTRRLDQQNLHGREVLAESVIQPGNVQLTKYRADGPTIFAGTADTSSDAAGTIKEVFDKQSFRKFVAIAEGQA